MVRNPGCRLQEPLPGPQRWPGAIPGRRGPPQASRDSKRRPRQPRRRAGQPNSMLTRTRAIEGLHPPGSPKCQKIMKINDFLMKFQLLSLSELRQRIASGPHPPESCVRARCDKNNIKIIRLAARPPPVGGREGYADQ